MKTCVSCGEELEDSAKFCSRCGKPQTEKKPPSKEAIQRKTLDLDNLSLRQYFREAASSWKSLTEARKTKLAAFLKKKDIGKGLLPKAEKTLLEMMALYTEYVKDKQADKPFKEIQKSLKAMQTEFNELLGQFEKAVETAKEKKAKAQQGKTNREAFQEKARNIYEKLKEASENDGSCDDKGCGCNNCYQFALKVAAGKEEISLCPKKSQDWLRVWL